MEPTTVSFTLPGARTRALAVGVLAGALAAALVSSALAPHSALAVDPTVPREHTISVSGTAPLISIMS